MVTASAAPVQSTRSKARDPRTVELSRRPDGTFAALSSDGVSLYTLRQVGDGWVCTCKGYVARRACCHATAARLSTCYWCESTVNVETYINGWDRGAELSLCAACFTRKEVA